MIWGGSSFSDEGGGGVQDNKEHYNIKKKKRKKGHFSNLRGRFGCLGHPPPSRSAPTTHSTHFISGYMASDIW